VAGQLENVAQPDETNDLIKKMNKVWVNRLDVKSSLEKNIPRVKQLGKENFIKLKELF
jgi:hypothetical protein